MSLLMLWVLNFAAIVLAGVIDPYQQFLPAWAGAVSFVMLFFYGFFLHMKAHKAVGRPKLRPEGPLKLVTTGAYARSRHPGYLGLILMGFSFALLFGSVLAAVVQGVFSGIWAAVAMNEERFLLEKFGKKYEAYKKKTGFMIPKWW